MEVRREWTQYRPASRDLLWYVKRVRVMPLGEIPHRLREQWRLIMLRLSYQMSRVVYADRRRAVHRDSEEFAFCTAKSPQLPSLPWLVDLDKEARTMLLDGRLEVLGTSWRWRPDHRVWHEAPDTGSLWPQMFFASIPYRPGNPFGDARVVWESARLQHLVSLALIAREGNDEVRQRAVDLLEAQLCAWVTANPVLSGIHYVSAMECALRIIAVCHALDLTRDYVKGPHHVWPALLTIVETHAHLIAQRISTHSSHGNHTVAEAAGLVYAGILFPELPHACAWVEQGIHLLQDSVSHLMQTDGGGVEQSLWYHWFVTDLYGLVARLLEHRWSQAPVALAEAHERAAAFLSEFGESSIQLPNIGDGDQGYAVSPFLRVSSRTAPSLQGLRTLQQSGYSIIRTADETSATLIFDHGPLGLPPCYGHGHADALSVVLSARSRAVLVDSGTYSYGNDTRWRAYFRGTRAHNTVTVDGLDQAVQEAPFLWSQPYTATLHHRLVEPDGTVTLLASHDGYRARTGVVHWRGVQYQPSDRWLVWDYLTGTGVHELELHWHINGRVRAEGRHVVVEDDRGVLDMQVQGGEVSLHRGERDPIRGWHAPTYGTLEPITTVRVTSREPLPHEFLTTLTLGHRVEVGTSAMSVSSLFRRWVHEAQTGDSARRSG